MVRIHSTRIAGLRYEPQSGYAVIDLDEGELWVSAAPEGCHVFYMASAGWEGD